MTRSYMQGYEGINVVIKGYEGINVVVSLTIT
jgi:hypothetical protein